MSAAHSPPVNLFVRPRTLAVRFRREGITGQDGKHEGDGGERRPGAGPGRIRVTGATQDQGNGRDPCSAATSSRSARCSAPRPCAGCRRRRTTPRSSAGRQATGRTRPTQDGSVTRLTSTGVRGTHPRPDRRPPRRPARTRAARPRLLAADRPREGGVHDHRVGGDDGHPDTGRGDLQRRQAEDLARLVADLRSSSDDQPSAFSEPAHGTTFMASGAGKGPRSPTTERLRQPARCPSDRVPATLSSCA